MLPVHQQPDVIKLARCGLSPTYHLTPLAIANRQYDVKPTRGYHSIMFIHDSLDTRAFSCLPCTIRQIYHAPQTLAGPLPPVNNRVIGSSSPFPIVCLLVLYPKYLLLVPRPPFSEVQELIRVVYNYIQHKWTGLTKIKNREHFLVCNRVKHIFL